MESDQSPSLTNRGAVRSPDSDAWSFDFGAAENVEGVSEERSPKDETRRTARRRSPEDRSRPRDKYNSPPPDYRSSVKDRKPPKGMAPGLVPSYYNVGAFYTNQPIPTIQPDQSVLTRSATSPAVHDASVRAPAGFQRILKGWDDHHAAKRSRLSRIFKRDTYRRASDGPSPMHYQPEPRSEDILGQSTPTELSADTSVSISNISPERMKNPILPSANNAVNGEPSRPKSLIVPVKCLKTPIDKSQPRWLDSQSTVLSQDSPAPKSPSPSSGVSSAQWRRASQRTQRAVLEDVAEHGDNESTHNVVMPRTPVEPGMGTYVMRSAASAASAYIHAFSDGLKALHDLLPIEPPVPQGHTRIRWTCRCGDALFDDFIENEPGAAERLQAELNKPLLSKGLRKHRRLHSSHHRSRGSGGSSTPSRSESNGGSSIFSTASTQSSATSSGDIGDMSLNSGGSGSSSRLNKSTFTTQANETPHLVPLGTESDVPWLLTCCNEARLTPKLTHLSMDSTTVNSDRDVALALRRHYDSVHTGVSALVRLRGLKSIDFVKFEVHRNRFTDIRAKPHMPPYPHPSAIPGYDPERPDSISWAQTTDYSFEPGHLVPPVGPRYLMHLFEHPHDYDMETITLKRIPKKLGGKLDFGVGWGVELVEGFVHSRVWALLFALMVTTSAIFIGVWLTRGGKGDVQGAFAVAGWFVACIGILGGWIGAMVE